MSNLDLDYFETVIVYKAITDEIYLSSIIDHIKPIFFKDKDIKNVFGIIHDYFIKRNCCPSMTEVKAYLTTDELKTSFKNVVVNFKDIDKNLNADELYQNTETFLKEKAVFHTMMEVVEDLNKQKLETSTVLSKFESACNISLTTNTGLDLFKDVDKLVDDLSSDVKYLPTGWGWLDNKIGGGFLESGRSLYIFTGETNIGKSIFLGNVAINIANQGKSVLLVTLEMPEMIYAQRLSSNITKVPLSKIKTEIPTLKHALENHADSNPGAKILIKEFPPSTITIAHLQSYIKKLLNQGYKFDAIVVDYINLFHTPEGTNSYEKIKKITEQLRALSYVFTCPIISATQLNRGGFGMSDPGMNTISESVGLAMTADVIMSIWQEATDRELGVIKMGMMKNRFGPNFGSCILRIDYSTLTLTEDEHVNDTEASNSSINTLAALSL
jgi:replicative DNA helicase